MSFCALGGCIIYMNVINPPIVSSVQPYLLANAVGVDANSLATTSLNWIGTMNAANTFPLFARIYRVTGTMALLIATLKLNSIVIATILAAESAQLAATTSALQYPLSSTVSVTPMPVAGNYQLTVGTINGSGATITVEVWGFKIS